MSSTRPAEYFNEVTKAIKFSKNHYENFPVLSLFYTKKQKQAISLIYKFARIADDIADSETLRKYQKIVNLDLIENQLKFEIENENKPFYDSLKFIIQESNLKIENLFNLLKAFKFDAEENSFPRFDSIIDYTKNSANTIGRLVLELHGFENPKIIEYSDYITTALQLTNFLQDIKQDFERGRIYFADEDLENYKIKKDELLEKENIEKLQQLYDSYIPKIQDYYDKGKPILNHLPWKLKVLISMTIKSGETVLQKIKNEKVKKVVEKSPRISNLDKIKMILEVIIEK